MAIPGTISAGATGATVDWAQYLLVHRTLSYTQINGVFGPVTAEAVEEFQRGAGLTVDGIVRRGHLGPRSVAKAVGRRGLADDVADLPLQVQGLLAAGERAGVVTELGVQPAHRVERRPSPAWWPAARNSSSACCA